jgi:hypothetical protein
MEVVDNNIALMFLMAWVLIPNTFAILLSLSSLTVSLFSNLETVLINALPGRTKQVIADSGLMIGEENNSLIAYLTYTSRKRHTPLHLMYLVASGTGRTWLQEKVSEN